MDRDDYWYDFDDNTWCHFETVINNEKEYKIAVIREPWTAHPSWDIPMNCN